MQSNQPPEDIVYEGWLSKEGHFVPTWKRRYFYLEARGIGSTQVCKLSYFDHPDKNSMPKGIITLSAASIG